MQYYVHFRQEAGKDAHGRNAAQLPLLTHEPTGRNVRRTEQPNNNDQSLQNVTTVETPPQAAGLTTNKSENSGKL